MTTGNVFPVLRGRNIRVDDQNLVCLDDIWRAGGFTKTLTPISWWGLAVNGSMIIEVAQRNSGKTKDLTKQDMQSAIRRKRGADGGVYADVRIALAYAEYLNPKLAIEVREVFLRYKAADATLADEILQEAPADANEWVARRAMGRAVRHGFTATLRAHGVSRPPEFGMCTNAVYQGLFGKTAKQLKETKGVSGSLRDHMDMRELAYVMAAEALSGERIEEEACSDAHECRSATSKSARSIRDAIEGDRRDRSTKHPRLL